MCVRERSVHEGKSFHQVVVTTDTFHGKLPEYTYRSAGAHNLSIARLLLSSSDSRLEEKTSLLISLPPSSPMVGLEMLVDDINLQRQRLNWLGVDRRERERWEYMYTICLSPILLLDGLRACMRGLVFVR